MGIQVQQKQSEIENIRPVSIGEIVVSRSSADILVAYGLGSCVGICAYDPTVQVGGMLHALLPTSNNGNNANNNPAKYVDQGVELLVESLEKLGAKRNRLIINMGGGAQMLAAPGFNNSLNIGQRNVEAAQTSLKAAGLRIRAQDTGGHSGRTLKLYLTDGKVTVKTLGHGEQSLS